MNAREIIESQGRKPVLGWAQDRKIDLKQTDVKRTWRRVERVIKQSTIQKSHP
jgi:hypothetical protein